MTHSRASHKSLLTASAAAVAAAWPLCASAEFSDWDLAFESFMGAENGVGVFLAAGVGVDEGSVLSYEGSVDPNTLAFSWATLSGQSFLGQSLTVTGAGSFDSLTQTASWSADFVWNGRTSHMDGSDEWSTVLDEEKKAKKKYKLYRGDVEYELEGGLWVTYDSAGQLENSWFSGKLTNKDTGLVQDISGQDKRDRKNKRWSITTKTDKCDNLPDGASVGGDGSYDPGGQGSFSQTVTPVPEPSTVGLLAMGLAGLLIRRART